MRSTAALLSLLFLLVPGLVGCTALQSTTAPSRDLCQLLTVAEIDQYWGWPDTKPESEQGELGPTCGWRDTSGIDETVFRLNLSPFGPKCEEARNFSGSEEIASIGDWAYWSEDRTKMYVKKGGSCLEVIGNYPGSVDVDYMTNIKELARLAVSRL